MNTHTHTHTGL